jgi:hypothetical protein
MSPDLEVISLLQEQNKELREELARAKAKHKEALDMCERYIARLHKTEAELKAAQEQVGEDIWAFYNKAKDVIESQFGLGITMRPGDLIKLWLNFLRLAQGFSCQVASARIIAQFEQSAFGMATQMMHKGDLMLEGDQLGAMLERIVYPYITVTVGGETITWKELREKYGR